ncbi:MAG: hypothetical protein HYZ74_07820, partial [Elusimicrobia bacterium]|nr:hypothetical protein [Elusimicrobiota bacterium]
DKGAKEISAIVEEGKPGWEDRASRLLERRRALLEAFAGDENPMYQAYREMKESAWSLANNDALLSQDPVRYNEAGKLLNKKIDGEAFSTFLPKLIWRALRGQPMKIEEVGLTRLYAWKMTKALFQDPMATPTQRDNLLISFLNSMLFPKGIGHNPRGSSWVRTEIVNMVDGYHENPAGVRLDNRVDKFNVVHNGQWFESMDNPTRRWWELEYGVDLTLPYSHQSISTIKDVTTFKKARFISLSGTSGPKFEAHMKEQNIPVVGKGSAMPDNVELGLVSGAAKRFTGELREALDKLPKESLDCVPLRETDIAHVSEGVKNSIFGYLKSQGLSLKNDPVVEISKVESPEAQAWLRQLRSTQGNSSLVSLSVSDTRVLRVIKNYLKSLGYKSDEIAMIFSDTEYLRLNVPEANVADQMNLDGLRTGKVKVLILDTRVGGRGIDLNYKGDRGNPAPDAFRGYTNMKMLVIDPQEMSQVHLLQAMGRIDKGRVLPGTRREFSLVMDVKSVQNDGLFRRVFSEDPFFVEMRKDPNVQKFARVRGATELTLSMVHDYVMMRESQATKREAGDGEGLLLAERYRRVMKDALERRQSEVESDQLRSSSVLQDRPSAGKHPGLQLLR